MCRSRNKGTGLQHPQVAGELNVSTPLTPAPVHLLCLYLVGYAEQVSELLNKKAHSWAFLAPEWAVHVLT
jgi:hypothetical protein